MKTVYYHFYKIINGCSVYQPYANIDHKFSICMNTKNRPCILIVDGKIKNVYVCGRNYQAERYLKKYKEDKELKAIIEELKKEV